MYLTVVLPSFTEFYLVFVNELELNGVFKLSSMKFHVSNGCFTEFYRVLLQFHGSYGLLPSLTEFD